MIKTSAKQKTIEAAILNRALNSKVAKKSVSARPGPTLEGTLGTRMGPGLAGMAPTSGPGWVRNAGKQSTWRIWTGPLGLGIRAQDRTQARVWMAPPRDSNRLLGLSDWQPRLNSQPQGATKVVSAPSLSNRPVKKFMYINPQQWACDTRFLEVPSRARKPWSANRELRGWQKRGCRDRCPERPEKGA